MTLYKLTTDSIENFWKQKSTILILSLISGSRHSKPEIFTTLGQDCEHSEGLAFFRWLLVESFEVFQDF